MMFFLRKRSPLLDRLMWDYEYSKGEWDLMHSTELTRIKAAKELLKKNVQNGHALEIGCGEGVFYHHVSDLNFGFYEGIDVSKVAINKIRKTENSSFVVADMESYTPQNAPFSVIILNEVLFYSKDPIRLLTRYSEFLKKDGVFLIGMYHIPKTDKIWNQINDHFIVLDTTEVSGDEWKWDYKIVGGSK